MRWCSYRTVEIKREDLYEQVWAEPMLKVAARYGVSGVALAKLCKKLDVPRPGRGYWAKLESGQKVHRAKLPRQPDEELLVGTLVKRPPRDEQDELNPITAASAGLLRQTKVVIPNKLYDLDPLVVQIQEAFATAYADQQGYLVSRRKDSAWIRVSRSTFDRALVLVDTLIKVCRPHGFAVSLGSGFVVATPAGAVEYVVEEQLENVEREPTPAEARNDGARPRLFGEPRRPRKYYRTTLTGRLSLRITSESPAQARRVWRDTGKRPFGSQLSGFVVGLIQFAENRQLKLEELERDRLAWEESRKRRQQDEIEERMERGREEEMWRLIKEWSKSEQIRCFARAYEISRLPAPETVSLGREDWLDWMLDYADQLDPLRAPNH